MEMDCRGQMNMYLVHEFPLEGENAPGEGRGSGIGCEGRRGGRRGVAAVCTLHLCPIHLLLLCLQYKLIGTAGANQAFVSIVLRDARKHAGPF